MRSYQRLLADHLCNCWDYSLTGIALAFVSLAFGHQNHTYPYNSRSRMLRDQHVLHLQKEQPRSTLKRRRAECGLGERSCKARGYTHTLEQQCTGTFHPTTYLPRLAKVAPRRPEALTKPRTCRCRKVGLKRLDLTSVGKVNSDICMPCIGQQTVASLSFTCT